MVGSISGSWSASDWNVGSGSATASKRKAWSASASKWSESACKSGANLHHRLLGFKSPNCSARYLPTYFHDFRTIKGWVSLCDSGNETEIKWNRDSLYCPDTGVMKRRANLPSWFLSDKKLSQFAFLTLAWWNIEPAYLPDWHDET